MVSLPIVREAAPSMVSFSTFSAAVNFRSDIDFSISSISTLLPTKLSMASLPSLLSWTSAETVICTPDVPM